MYNHLFHGLFETINILFRHRYRALSLPFSSSSLNRLFFWQCRLMLCIICCFRVSREYPFYASPLYLVSQFFPVPSAFKLEFYFTNQ